MVLEGVIVFLLNTDDCIILPAVFTREWVVEEGGHGGLTC